MRPPHSSSAPHARMLAVSLFKALDMFVFAHKCVGGSGWGVYVCVCVGVFVPYYLFLACLTDNKSNIPEGL